MGIPGLYRWLVDRYPNTLCCVAEERSRSSLYPTIDSTTPNPNGVEFDNLYIDMNGIIHPCFHPEGLPAPQSYDVVLNSIFRYIDRVFSIVRPRKLLYLAVDGVAPRAKMNHQRIRRFRAAKEATAEVSKGDKKLDSNVITPGTEFMELLSCALQYYVHLRMNSDTAWRKIKVLLSDSTVVGEGEHKIFSYIRSQRNLPGYDPNTRHCFHGLDADLIILALATHEIHVSILREVIVYGKCRKNNLDAMYPGRMKHYLDNLKFEFFNVWVLREYLERELLPISNVEGADFERLIDDFVFICLFVGNDFLPRLPSLDISEGGIELLLIVYQQEFANMGYLTESSKVNLKSMEHFLQALSTHENAIFMKRAQVMKEKGKRKRSGSLDAVSVKKQEIYRKPIYYTRNFDCYRHDIDRIKRDAVLKYTQGVCWTMDYYYQGVCSWQWFYPYHYAPFASDFCGLEKLEIHFTLGQPLKPLDQLLGVLPAARELMTKQSSPILDFYPKDAKVDRNGKKHAWQGVCKLPFIDESRLLSESVKLEHTLTAEEKQRNTFGRDRLFVHSWHPLGHVIKDQDHHPTSELQIQISPRHSGGMNGYLCISAKPVCPPQIPSPVDDKHVTENQVKSVGFKRPCHAAHVSKLLSGVIMPPQILRSQDSPPPPVVWQATSKCISLTEESQKKKREGDKDEKLGGEQHGSKGGVGCTNGKSETEKDLVEKSRNVTELPSSMVGNEKKIEVGEKTSASSSTTGMEHASLGGEAKRRKLLFSLTEESQKKKREGDKDEKLGGEQHGSKGGVGCTNGKSETEKDLVEKSRNVTELPSSMVGNEKKIEVGEKTSASSSTTGMEHASLGGEAKRRKQEKKRVRCEKLEVSEKPKTNEDVVGGEKPTINKKHKKIGQGGEDKMNEAHEILREEEKIDRLANGQEEMEGGGDNKRKKQKKSKTKHVKGEAEKSNDFRVGEETNKKKKKKKEQAMVESEVVVGSVQGLEEVNAAASERLESKNMVKKKT